MKSTISKGIHIFFYFFIRTSFLSIAKGGGKIGHGETNYKLFKTIKTFSVYCGN